MNRRKQNEQKKQRRDSIAKNRIRFVILFASMTAILVGILMIEVFNDWKIFDSYLGSEGTKYTRLNPGEISFNINIHNTGLAIQNLEAIAIRYSTNKSSLNELESAIKKTKAGLKDFNLFAERHGNFGDSISYASASSKTKVFIDSVESLRDGHELIGEIIENYNSAISAWLDMATDSDVANLTKKQNMERSIDELRPLYHDAFFVIYVLLILCIVTLCAAVYAGWKLIAVEKSRFESFENLVASIGHDLRSPLQSIQSASALLTENTLSKADRERFGAIVKASTKSVARLVEDIIQVVKRESLSYEIHPVNLHSWFYILRDTYSSKVRSNGLQWIDHFEGGESIYEIDEDRLTQCVGNLLDNSIRYTNNGFVKLSITIRKESREDRHHVMVVKVSDSGCGIALEDQKRIFEPFQRASNAESNKGMGLGLSIIKNFVNAHGGDISVESHINQGSTFKFILPVLIHNHKSDVNSSKQESKVVGNGDNEVLLVDDDDQISATLFRVIHEAGFSIENAQNGEEALLKISSTTFSVVLMDIEMPKMDGFSLALRCKELKTVPYLIAITAHCGSSEIKKMEELFDEVLIKPVAEGRLLDAIEVGLKRNTTSTKFGSWSELSPD